LGFILMIRASLARNARVMLWMDNAAMSITVTLSTGLRAFVTDSLKRGQAPAALIEALIGNRIEARVAKAVVDAFLSAQAAGAPLPEHSIQLDMEAPRYQYEPARMAAGNVLHAAGREIRVLQRLQQPIVAILERVFSEDECSRLIELARPRLRPSTVVVPRSGVTAVVDYRSSDGMFFRPLELPFIAELDQRIAALMNCPVHNGEGLQVVRYGRGGQYPPHFDFKIPSNAANSESIARSGQRISTLIVYLNDVAAGGETVFPEVGLSVVPRRGNGLYFEYTNSQMQVDQKSRHAGAPVGAGEKWIATKWMRARRFISQGAAE
jgi:prolyl 4-hydroxylase